MQQIKIEDIYELITKGYPPQTVQELLDEVLRLSLIVKTDYPEYKEWYINKQIPGIYNNSRNIIIARINKKIVGFISLKKAPNEKKICTFYVEKNYQKNKIGTILVEKAIEYLEEEKPLITIPMDKLKDYTKIAHHYNWQITDIKENLYRLSSPEVIVNGSLEETNHNKIITKDFNKYYYLYKFSQVKSYFKNKCLVNIKTSSPK